MTIAAGAFLLAVLFIAARWQDDLARDQAVAQAEAGLRETGNALMFLVQDYGLWSEAFENLVVAPDPDRSDRNIGRWLNAEEGIAAVFAIDSSDRPLYAAVDGEQQAAEAMMRVSSDLAEIVSEVRTLPPGSRATRAGFVLFDGRPALAAVSPIRSTAGGRAEPPGGSLVLLRRLEGDILPRLAALLQIPSLAFAPGPAAVGAGPDGVAALPIVSAAGRPLGILSWEPARPGARFLSVMLPSCTVIFLVIAGVAWAMWLRVQGARRRVSEALAALVQQTERLHAARSEAEQARAAAEELRAAAEEASQAKSRFLAAMSHELRTPLTAIIGFAEIIRDRVVGPAVGDQYVEYAGHIHASGVHLLDLITDILDLAKIEAGRLEIEPKWLNLKEVVPASLWLVRDRAAKGQIQLAAELPEPAPALFADGRAVKQILFNLLSNAVRFTPAGGQVTVRVAHSCGGGVDLAVADTGVGIPTDAIDRVTRPFEQGDNRYGSAKGGTGLGLALVKALAELHGGSLSIASTVGVGTTVTVRFPPAPAAALRDGGIEPAPARRVA